MAVKTKRVIIWCAVSSDEQVSEGKSSIPDQLARQRARAAANGWEIVDTIIIDGFSRRYFTFLEFAQAAAAAGITAPMRMYSHFEKRDFDILSMRDLSRIGREQSIMSEVVSRTIAAGAVVWPLDESMLDVSNYRMGSAISGVGSSQHVDNLIRYREMGMSANVERGLKMGTKPPRFYIEIRDPVTNKPVGMKPDRERYQRFFDDFVTAYCINRLSYDALGQYLYEFFGHLDPLTGKPYTKHVIYGFLFNSATWGHTVYGRRRKHNRDGSDVKWGYWITGDEPAPDGVKFFPNTVESIWQSPTLERVKSEFRHRHYTMKGRMAGRTKYTFSGLLVCDVCGLSFSGCHAQDYRYYRCTGRFGHNPTDCPNLQYIPESEVVDWLRPRIERDIAGLETVIIHDDAPPDTTARVEAIDNEIAAAESEIRRLSKNLGTLGDNSDRIFREEIKTQNDLIDRLNAARVAAVADSLAGQQRTTDRAEAVNELRELGSEAFWSQDSHVINQWLHRYLGNVRIAIRDRECVGFRVSDG